LWVRLFYYKMFKKLLTPTVYRDRLQMVYKNRPAIVIDIYSLYKE
jgi:hypothetical protein